VDGLFLSCFELTREDVLAVAELPGSVVIAVGLLVVAAGMGLTALIPAFGAACVGRFLAGMGGAGSNLPAMALEREDGLDARYGRRTVS
jgi:hypothetical protein